MRPVAAEDRLELMRLKLRRMSKEGESVSYGD
jgi:hypothetical protein